MRKNRDTNENYEPELRDSELHASIEIVRVFHPFYHLRRLLHFPTSFVRRWQDLYYDREGKRCSKLARRGCSHVSEYYAVENAKLSLRAELLNLEEEVRRVSRKQHKQGGWLYGSERKYNNRGASKIISEIILFYSTRIAAYTYTGMGDKKPLLCLGIKERKGMLYHCLHSFPARMSQLQNATSFWGLYYVCERANGKARELFFFLSGIEMLEGIEWRGMTK